MSCLVKDKDKIFLIGSMGSGKSSIGRLLANDMDFQHFDIDHIIEKNKGSAIHEIFDSLGEDYFRDIESDTLKHYGNMTKAVISTGGGCVMKNSNHDVLKKGLVVYLKISVNAQFDRIKNRSHRPLFKNSDSKLVLVDLDKKRGPIYENLSDIIIDVSNQDKRSIVLEINEKLK